VYKTHVHGLDNDSLLRIFSYYRLEDKHNWNIRHMWLNLAHVCGRWRCIIYDSPGLLGLCLLLANNSPSLDTLNHLPLLPLVIDYSVETGTVAVARKDEHNIHLALRQHYRVRRVALQGSSSDMRMWLEPMNKLFPRLGDLSLLSTTIEEMDLVLPETFQAPDLCRLSLHGIGLPRGLSFLSCVMALSTLSLTNIGASCYFSPGHLVTLLRSLLHLEELSIGFAIPIPLPSSEGELLPAPIPPVTLPTLRRLTFRGVDVYLESLVAQINTPLLERLSLTFLFDIAFTLVNLTEFIGRTEEFRCVAARIIFNKDGPSIDDEQRDIGKLSIRVNCKPLDWQVDSATQVCSALAKVLSAVEELSLDLDEDGMPLDWENTLDNMMWHELLLPFIGVKKLHIGFSLSFQLSQALESVAGGLVLELLPGLQELGVYRTNDPANRSFYAFVKTRESVGLPVHICRTYELPSSKPRIRPNPIRAHRSRMRIERSGIEGSGIERPRFGSRFRSRSRSIGSRSSGSRSSASRSSSRSSLAS
jgi:F-box-like